MRKALITLGLAAAVGVASQAVLAGEFDKPIKARQGLMQVYSFNIGILGAMAKGKMDYDAQMAQDAADNLLAAVSMKGGALWPAGSGNDNAENKTRAKPEIWSTYPKVAEKSKALKEAAAKMAAAAGNGLDAVKANIGDVGKGCKGCHENFRAEKK